jgi:hypothetical protein
MALCGFGKVVTNNTWEARFPFGTDIEGRFLYVRDGERQWLLAAFDFSYTYRRTSLAFRKAISAETGIPVENIWTHESQSHSAPVAPELAGKACERLIEACLPAIRDTVRGAEEAEMSYVVADLGDRFNLNREQYIPGVGAVTVWSGLEFDEADRPYSQDPSIMLLREWKPDVPAFQQRIYFDRPADPQAAMVLFRRPGGGVIGTLTRFAAHPDIVGACATNFCRGGLSDYRYHFDWPGHVRQAAEERLGGMGVCVVGPCGNLGTKKRSVPGYESGDQQSRQLGYDLVNACLGRWEDRPTAWKPLRLNGLAHTQAYLPLRETFPKSRAEVAKAPEKAEEYRKAYQAAIQENQPPHRIRELIDLCHHWSWTPNIVDRWCGLSDEELARSAMSVELEAVGLNDLVLAGLPGESLTETCQWLRAQSLGERLVVVDMVNGYGCYQTTREQYDLGGYSAACSCLSRDADRTTRRETLRLIREVMR